MNVAILGGGLCGTLTGMLLADDGHDVMVLERDPQPPPDDPELAWDNWDRRSVRQFHLGHLFLPRFRHDLSNELPDVVAALKEAGALALNVMNDIPDVMTGGWQDTDDRYGFLTGRRPMVEAVIANAADAAGLIVHRGTVVDRLLVDESRPGHVRGVTTVDGQEVTADLVVDAGGRNSPLPRLLEEAGARSPSETKDDSGFVYYGRTVASQDGSLPGGLGLGLVHHCSVSTLTLPADHGNWFCGIVAASGDKPMRKLSDPETFDRVWRSFPSVAHWMDGDAVGEGVKIMAGIEDRIRHYVVDGEPVATGIAAVGDAWACTNPSVGRGASIGLMNAVALRDHLRETDLNDPRRAALDWHAVTERTVRPWFDDTIINDQHRLRQVQAEIDGIEFTTDDAVLRAFESLPVAMFHDPDLLRAFLDNFMMFRTRAQLSSPEFLARVDELAPDGPEPHTGPSRSELLALVNRVPAPTTPIPRKA